MEEKTINPQEAVSRYEQLKLEIKERETELDELKPVVEKCVPEDEELVTEKGYFYIQKRPRYTFSDNVEELRKSLKRQEENEIKTGEAKVDYMNVLYYKVGKPKNTA